MKTKKLVWISIIIIILCFGSSTAMSIKSIRTVEDSNEENYARTVAGGVYDAINGELSRPIIVGQIMAHNIFLLDLIDREQAYSEEKKGAVICDYLKDVAADTKYDIVYVIFDKSKKYYTQDGFSKIIDPENDVDDKWYSKFVESDREYNLDIDLDELHDYSWTIFANNKIRDKDGNIIGVCGVGMIMTYMQDIISDLQKKYNIHISLVNQDGVVQVDVDDIKIDNSAINILDLDSSDSDFKYTANDDGYIVTRYMDNLGLYLVVQKDKKDMNDTFSNIILKNLISMLVLLTLLSVCVYILFNKSNKDIAIEAKTQSLSSLAGIYTSMHLIDLKKNEIKEIKSNSHINSFIDKKSQTATEQLRGAMKGMTTDEYLDDVLAFTELTTLADRMKGMRTISMEFLGKYSGWCRGRFIAEGEDLDNIEQVIFAVEVIEKEKRREKELIALSETDRMTGLRNRTSGERQIAEYLLQKKQGMLLLLDVDDFKSVNDNFGHDVGDKVIIEIADCLKNTFRDLDVIMRLGGDEYMVYVLGIQDRETGDLTVERLFFNIGKLKLPEIKDRKICISVGAALYNGQTRTSFQEMYKKVDTMMYESKKTEGNYCTYTDI